MVLCLNVQFEHAAGGVRQTGALQCGQKSRLLVRLRLPGKAASGVDLRRKGDHASRKLHPRKQRLGGKRL